MTENRPHQNAGLFDPWSQAMETFVAATNFYAQAMEAVMVASTGMMADTLQSSTEAASSTSGRSDKATGETSRPKYAIADAYRPPKLPSSGRSWYRPPVQHPFLEMIDDVMKPWRTFVPDHSASTFAARTADMFRSDTAAEFMAAYHTGTGFTMAHISFPDEKSVCLTMPAPWALLTQR